VRQPRLETTQKRLPNRDNPDRFAIASEAIVRTGNVKRKYVHLKKRSPNADSAGSRLAGHTQSEASVDFRVFRSLALRPVVSPNPPDVKRFVNRQRAPGSVP
jgi:hypothetical protein